VSAIKSLGLDIYRTDESDSLGCASDGQASVQQANEIGDRRPFDPRGSKQVALFRFSEDDAHRKIATATKQDERTQKRGKTSMNSKTKLVLGILTALAMLLLTFAVPRGGALRDTQLAMFPVTVGVWAIFVLLFVKLK
jgi:hypothetical protein